MFHFLLSPMGSLPSLLNPPVPFQIQIRAEKSIFLLNFETLAYSLCEKPDFKLKIWCQCSLTQLLAHALVKEKKGTVALVCKVAKSDRGSAPFTVCSTLDLAFLFKESCSVTPPPYTLLMFVIYFWGLTDQGQSWFTECTVSFISHWVQALIRALHTFLFPPTVTGHPIKCSQALCFVL